MVRAARAANTRPPPPEPESSAGEEADLLIIDRIEAQRSSILNGACPTPFGDSSRSGETAGIRRRSDMPFWKRRRPRDVTGRDDAPMSEAVRR